jgi:hypothetical protein
MATVTWEVFIDTPAWADTGSNRLVFSGDGEDHAASVVTQQFQDGTHVGTGTPGADDCGATHANNVKLISATEMSLNGGATETIDDTNLGDDECSFRLHFNDAAEFSLQNVKIYAYDGDNIENPAVGVDAAVYVKGEGMTGWETLNSDSTEGPTVSGMDFETGDIGGYGSGIELGDRAADADHFFYVALSVAPETSGGKNLFALGCYLEYY